MAQGPPAPSASGAAGCGVSPAALVRFRAAHSRAEADEPWPETRGTRAELERHFAARAWATAYRVQEAGLDELAATFCETARLHSMQANRIAAEAEVGL